MHDAPNTMHDAPRVDYFVTSEEEEIASRAKITRRARTSLKTQVREASPTEFLAAESTVRAKYLAMVPAKVLARRERKGDEKTSKSHGNRRRFCNLIQIECRFLRIEIIDLNGRGLAANERGS